MSTTLSSSLSLSLSLNSPLHLMHDLRTVLILYLNSLVREEPAPTRPSSNSNNSVATLHWAAPHQRTSKFIDRSFLSQVSLLAAVCLSEAVYIYISDQVRQVNGRGAERRYKYPRRRRPLFFPSEKKRWGMGEMETRTGGSFSAIVFFIFIFGGDGMEDGSF